MTNVQICGLGTDIVTIARFRNLDPAAPFFTRVFADAELEFCRGFSDPAPHFASTFAAKEAVVKALPDESTIKLRDIEIRRDESGAPHVKLGWSTSLVVLISVSHNEEYAVSVAISLPDSSGSNSDELRKLLNSASSEILPE